MPPTQFGMQGQPPPQYGANTSTVVVRDGFDAGARFDMNRPTIPVSSWFSCALFGE